MRAVVVAGRAALAGAMANARAGEPVKIGQADILLEHAGPVQ